MSTLASIGWQRPSTPSPFRLSGQPGLKFGCRLFAYMASNPYPNQDKFIRQALIDGQNALQKQSAKTMDEENDGGRFTWGAFVSNAEQQDGYGIARYEPGTPNPFITRSNLHAASAESKFAENVAETAQKKPLSLLVHIRQGPNAIQLNNHPFQFGQWSFMHNGKIPDSVILNLEPDIERYAARYGHPVPQGTIDTERVFYYMLGKMRDEFGTTDASRINTYSLRQFYAQTIGDILRQSNEEAMPWFVEPTDRFQRLTGVALKRGSSVQIPVGANFILSDGNRTLAVRSGRDLFLGVRQGAGGAKEVLIATQPIQPKKTSRLAKVQWFEIPEHHLVTVERKNGQLEVSIDPLHPKSVPVADASDDHGG